MTSLKIWQAVEEATQKDHRLLNRNIHERNGT